MTSVVDRNITLQENLKSWPLIGRAKIISTNERSFALASQPFYPISKFQNVHYAGDQYQAAL